MRRTSDRRRHRRRRGRGRRGWLRDRALTLVALTLVTVATAALAWLLIVYPRRPASGAGHRVEVEIEPGLGIGALADRLAAEGVIEEPFLWSVYMRLLGADDELRDGTVQLTDVMTPAEVTRHVARGFGNVRVQVTIPEGFNRFDVAERLERMNVCDADEFVAATSDRELLDDVGLSADSAEGYLFPDTYELREGLSPRAVIGRLVRNFRQRVMPIVDEHADGLATVRRDLGWSLHEVVTLASVVEKEAARDDERPRIAGVFLNRLRSETFRPQRLQADPTVSYGCRVAPTVSDACAAFDGRHITRRMLTDTDNPYNTYRADGLPPGPIANPGVGSIEAVLAPEAHGFLYFVARGGGRHAFSETLDAHNRAVQRYVRGEP